jgi:hypothetical protein
MSRLAVRMVPAFVALAVAVIFLSWSHVYEGRSQTVPVLVGWCALVFTILDIIAQTDTRAGRLLHEILSGEPLDSAASLDTTTPTSRAVAACAWIAAFVALVAVIGFIAAIPVYTLAFMRLQGRLPWRKSAITAVVITAITWIVFEQLLSYKVFEGWVFGGQF